MINQPGECSAEGQYARLHEPRYVVLIDLLRPFVKGDSRMLDIGRSILTDRLHDTFKVRVDSIGFQPDGPTRSGMHRQFDLNDCQKNETWLSGMPKYDVIVFAEVIEHLYTSPARVLAFIRTLLEPDGILIIQTPNALSLTKRAKAILGIHPYEKIREDNTNPGHFREYTRSELRSYAAGAGFEVIHFGFYNYFDSRYGQFAGVTRPRWVEALKYRLSDVLPGFLKAGITMILRPARGS